MTGPLVVAPHPDDEVLGCSSVLRGASVHVVHVTDGVPPWIPPVERRPLAEQRRDEAIDAWGRLSARVELRPLGFGDLEAWRSVPTVADKLIDAILSLSPTSVYLPAFQRGHPDHDATYLAGALARLRLDGDGPADWRVYGLYGFDEARQLRFGSLPGPWYGPIEAGCQTVQAMDAKADALKRFASQLWPGSALDRWLSHPFPEHFAPLPARWADLPDLPSFYDEELGFGRHGASAATVEAAFALALADYAGQDSTTRPVG